MMAFLLIDQVNMVAKQLLQIKNKAEWSLCRMRASLFYRPKFKLCYLEVLFFKLRVRYCYGMDNRNLKKTLKIALRVYLLFSIILQKLTFRST